MRSSPINTAPRKILAVLVSMAAVVLLVSNYHSTTKRISHRIRDVCFAGTTQALGNKASQKYAGRICDCLDRKIQEHTKIEQERILSNESEIVFLLEECRPDTRFDSYSKRNVVLPL